MPAKKATTSIFELKILLIGIQPPIWRRVQVPSTMSLRGLHDTFQAVMGWKNSHLHLFEKDGRYWGPQHCADEDLDVIDDGGVTVAAVLQANGDSMLYVYDFGDNWRHEVVLEKILPTDGAATGAICLAGERRCPPEDVGGVPGYQEFLEVIFDPAHKDYKRLVRWAGGPFHADEFDLDAVNEKLSSKRRAGAK